MLLLADRPRRRREYVDALEEERRKIEAFQRELPLSLQIITHELERRREEMESEEDAARGGGAVLEEFMALKPASPYSELVEENKHGGGAVEEEEANKKPVDWLRSARLWNEDSEALTEGDRRLCKPVAVRKCGGAFQPFERPAVAAASSTAESGGDGGGGGGGSGGGGNEEEGQSQPRSRRKARRCWSPELHRRFLHALQQLGGAHVATPKHIRELMKVDELTNDEVKSHLQKYRLHTRRPSSSQGFQANSSTQTPQFVLVGSLWMPPPDYAAAAAAVSSAGGTDASRTEIYAPVASLPSESRFQHQQKHSKQHSQGSSKGPLFSEGKESRGDDSLADDGATKSVSVATSSSS